jgi:hypothetical protein
MNLKFRCPKCGHLHLRDASEAGQKFACEGCAQPMRIPAAAAAPAPEVATTVLNFRCQACGTSYSTSTNLAGKKVKCKSCGQGIRVPGVEAAPTVAPTVAANTPRASAPATAKQRPATAPRAEPAPGGLSIDDLYGLDEAPKVARPSTSSDGIFSEAPGAAASAPVEEVLPARAGAYEPMTAAKKKKIAKRAAKVEKVRPTFGANSGLGISFGAVLTFALIGWRVYRVVHRFNDPGPAFNAAAPGAFNEVNFDPKVMVAEIDKSIAESLKEPGAAEAREWLDAAKHPDHAVMEMDNPRARQMVAGFYERGAKRVSVLDATKIGNTVVTASIAVELPADPAQRKKCFDWEVQYLQGEDPTKELNQKYLVISTD